MHLADCYETLADAFGDRVAIVSGQSRRTWGALDERSARLASALLQAGLGAGSKVGFFLYNGNEYIEAYYATLKIRGVAVNINYRYVEQELKYLLEYSDAEALVYHNSLADVVTRVARNLPGIKLLIEVDDGGTPVDGACSYERTIAAYLPAPRAIRSGDDLFMNFTGGTTGMPKGVVYRMGDVTRAYLNLLPGYFGIDETLTCPADLVRFANRLTDSGTPMVALPACPLMHTAGLMNGLLSPLLCGGTVVTLQGRSFDAAEMLEAIERECVSFVVIVGDAFCLPLLAALDNARDNGKCYDLSSLRIITSSGVAWSPEAKNRLLAYGDFRLIDAMGATEGGMGLSISSRAAPPRPTGVFDCMPSTRVFSEDNREIVPGSGELGYIAAGGDLVPIAYYKDPEKSARTFRVVDGRRYSFTGDMGTVDPDGTLRVFGRGSGCINTAGEKVFPEEVENVLREHPDVDDCLVLGAPHERFGQCVAAIVATRSQAGDLSQSIIDHCKASLAGYKCPRIINAQPAVRRGPNGKADYQWAKRLLNIES